MPNPTSPTSFYSLGEVSGAAAAAYSFCSRLRHRHNFGAIAFLLAFEPFSEPEPSFARSSQEKIRLRSLCTLLMYSILNKSPQFGRNVKYLEHQFGPWLSPTSPDQSQMRFFEIQCKIPLPKRRNPGNPVADLPNAGHVLT